MVYSYGYKYVACGYKHTGLISFEGNVDIIGKNKYGQCDKPDLNNRRVKQVACGYAFTVLLLDDGDVKLLGDMLGIGEEYPDQGEDSSEDYELFRMPALNGLRVIQIACGDRHTALLLHDGKVKLLGENNFGQCDMPKLRNRRVTKVACGYEHTALLLDDGDVEVFGDDDYEQCQIYGLYENLVTDIACGMHHTALLLNNGKVKLFGYNDNSEHQPVDIFLSDKICKCVDDCECKKPELNGRLVKQVACGYTHTALLLDDGDVKLFSIYTYGERKIPDLKGRRVFQVSCGASFTTLLLSDGNVKMFKITN